MKKTLALLLAALLAVSILASCASSKSEDGATSASPPRGEALYNAFSGDMAMPAPSSAPAGTDEKYMFDMELGETSISAPQSAAGVPELQKQAANMSEKIIYTINADIETVEFDATLDKVNAMLTGFGAFIENSYVGGRNYWQTAGGYQTYRTAWFTLRVPSEALTAITDSLGDLGSVTSVQRSAENVTSQYIDTESRLKSYRTQEERLFSMMAKAETVEDMLTIEKYLADVRYEIEAMTSQLANWQSRVDYSTLTLNISEVEKYSELPPPLPQTYWQQVKNEFGSTLRGIGHFFKNLLKWLIVSSPVLLLLAVICVVIAVAVIRRRAARRKNQADDSQSEDKR